MTPLYEPPWNRGESYEPDPPDEPRIWYWRGMKTLCALIVGSLVLLVVILRLML